MKPRRRLHHMILLMGLWWVDRSKLVTGWPQMMPWLLCRRDFVMIFFEFVEIRYPTIPHHDDELADIGGDSDDDLSHNAHNNLGVHDYVLGIAQLPIGPSPTLHISGICARHHPNY